MTPPPQHSGQDDSNQEPEREPEQSGQDDSARQADREPEQSDSGGSQPPGDQSPPGDSEASSGDPEAQQGSDQPASEQPAEAGEAPTSKKKRTGLLVGVAAAVVVILGGGAGLAFAFVGGDSARSVAEEYVAVTKKETQQPRSVTAENYRPIVCKKAMPQIEKMQKQKEKFLESAPPESIEKIKKMKISVKSVQENGDSGKAAFETTFPGQPPRTSELKMIKEDGDWKLCG